MQRPTGWQGIVWGGATAGACDITYAVVNNAVFGRSTAQRVLQSVAAGWLGRDAFSGGWPTAGLGLASHFLIAFIWATLFWAASRALAPFGQRPLLFGPLYGALVYVLMNTVVVPLSAAPFAIPLRLSGLLVHIFLVGTPIALAARRFTVQG